jgi:hypothetical protein
VAACLDQLIYLRDGIGDTVLIVYL